MLETLSFFLLLALFGLLIFLAIRLLSAAPKQAELARLQALEADALRNMERLTALAEEHEALKIRYARLEVAYQNEQQSVAEKEALMLASEERLKKEFELLSLRILEERGKALGAEQRERLDTLLLPLRQQLEAYRQRIEEVHHADTLLSGQLIEEVRQLQALSSRVSNDAQQLAHAIKGDSKVQGNWGEIIIERMFEASGLEKGREYLAQESFRDSDGALKRPDFMVLLPDNKAIIVDSKVSLTAFERYSALSDPDEQQIALREHLQSVRRHITELQAKNYHELGGNRTLDFVLLCIPIEAAWQAAMQADPALLYTLAGRNVVVCSPTTLMMTLKLIAQLWRREHENRNAELIAEKAGRIYDQVALLAHSMLEAQKKLSNVNDSFEQVLKQLKTGRGNLIGRVEEIRKLGAKVNRQMPLDVTAEALEE
uniref:DNA recombination protein RmuC n=1 Tax=Chlorobium chlorochromatii (strain CaD3) TaxID=340177 RepID=Q3ARL9_CHLCH